MVATATMPPHPFILVVDDDAETREVMQEVIASQGHEVRAAEDGLAALDVLQSTPYGCCFVLLDWRMPNLGGGDVLGAIRADPRLAHLPVVIATADGLTPERARAIGATGLLRKPVSPDALLALIERHGPDARSAPRVTG